jgi:GT2 family glycosyltransferase
VFAGVDHYGIRISEGPIVRTRSTPAIDETGIESRLRPPERDRPAFSILIPVHREGPAFHRCLEACHALEWSNFEVMVVSDAPIPDLPAWVVSVVTGAESDTSPAEKRDRGFEHTRGDIVAYLDDDAFPASTWLTAAAAHFSDRDVAAVGGPGITPSDSPWRERVGGSVYESALGSGPLRHRFWPMAPRYVDDFPAFNLLVRREAVETVGGWGTSFYGGEDTVLCLKLAALGMQVLYAPDVVVFHRRKPVVGPHLRQIANVGRHRGYFVRRYPESSRRVVYFLPMLVPIALVVAIAAAWARPAAGGIAALAGYLAIVIETARRVPLRVALATPFVLVAHHLAYGLSFARGSLGRPLSR